MPTYTLRNIKTKKSFDVFCNYTELQKMLEEDHNLVQMLVTPTVIGGSGSLLSKTSDGWKDHLKEIKKASGKGNTIKV